MCKTCSLDLGVGIIAIGCLVFVLGFVGLQCTIHGHGVT
jgi:hypothetical protein